MCKSTPVEWVLFIHTGRVVRINILAVKPDNIQISIYNFEYLHFWVFMARILLKFVLE